MRARHRTTEAEEAEVPLSPLIDCVFLLLIFFLVTSMFKRKEHLIPILLPDSTSALAQEPNEQHLVIGLDANGRVSKDSGKVNRDGATVYAPIDDLATYLNQVMQERGPGVLEQPLRIDCDREVPFQVAITTLDVCKLQGFTNVGIKTRKPKAR
ncbi:MAG: biopolymer transporter ExbD [Planctomycetota bacterium]|jgi:biopolymer transport protein ExbD|nr:biopolymer transporter ExbD [Planctomycetota bacterium]